MVDARLSDGSRVNVVQRDPDAHAIVICYEHDQVYLMMRLLFLESATLRRLHDMALGPANGRGLISALRNDPRHAKAREAVSGYANRLVLVKASGDTSTLDQVRQWAEEAAMGSPAKLLVVVDYLQKIPVHTASLSPETEVKTFLAPRAASTWRQALPSCWTNLRHRLRQRPRRRQL